MTARRRFFVPPSNIENQQARLPKDETHHLHHVLRLKAGDPIEIFDGKGAAYRGTLEFRDTEAWLVGLVPVDKGAEPDRFITLAPALAKTTAFEWILQKTTELGVHQVIPVITKRSDIRIPQGRLESKLQRWRRIVKEAAKQCRRSDVPDVAPPRPFEQFVRDPAFAKFERVLFYEKAGQPLGELAPSSSRIVLATGPEGGWTVEEVHAAEGEGYRICSLGGRILRVDTAAVVALAILQFQCGELAGGMK